MDLLVPAVGGAFGRGTAVHSSSSMRGDSGHLEGLCGAITLGGEGRHRPLNQFLIVNQHDPGAVGGWKLSKTSLSGSRSDAARILHRLTET